MIVSKCQIPKSITNFYIIGLATIWSFLTTGLLMIACIPNIADYGALMIGVPIRLPNTPPLEMVNVPPTISSVVILPYLPLSAKSIRVCINIMITLSISAKLSFSQFLRTGTINPLGVATAIEISI